MKNYSISESEWEIMKILWKRPNVTLSDIVKDLEGMSWSYSPGKSIKHIQPCSNGQ